MLDEPVPREPMTRPLLWLPIFAAALLILTAAAPDSTLYEPAVVRVVAAHPAAVELATGSGFFINERHVVTNHHVIDNFLARSNDAALFVLPSGSSEPLAVTVYWFDEDLDLAILDTGPGSAPGVLALVGDAPEGGVDVFAVGYPNSADAVHAAVAIGSTLTDGILSKPPFRAQWGDGGSTFFLVLQHTASINPGNSGGALIDACSGVIGVNTSGVRSDVRDEGGNVVGTTAAQGIFFAISVSELITVLDDLGLPYTTTAPCGATSVALQTVSPTSPIPHPITIALLATILLVLITLLMRRSRQPVAAGGAVAHERSVSPRISMRDAKDAGTATVRFSGQEGTPDLVLDAEMLRNARLGQSVGRHPSLVDCALTVEGLSKRHFRISVHRGKTFIEDLHSTNGTIVNDTKLPPYHGRRLNDGDIVCAGSGRWRFGA